jgi:hypothetical protein
VSPATQHLTVLDGSAGGFHSVPPARPRIPWIKITIAYLDELESAAEGASPFWNPVSTADVTPGAILGLHGGHTPTRRLSSRPHCPRGFPQRAISSLGWGSRPNGPKSPWRRPAPAPASRPLAPSAFSPSTARADLDAPLPRRRVCLAFTAGNRYADIQFLNNREIVTTWAQGRRASPRPYRPGPTSGPCCGRSARS